jgi:hypothetical protein
VVNHLQTHFKDANVAITCIYCNYKDQITQTVFNLVASLLKQILQDSSVTSGNVISFYDRHRDRDARPTLEDLVKTLESEIRMYSKVFIVVDALDEYAENECTEGSGTRADLLRVLQYLGETVNLMVTSRDLPSIARLLQRTKHLYICAVDQDVRKYVEARIASVPRRHLMSLQETIVNKVIENIRGM